MKRGIDELNDGMECVFDAEVRDGLWTHEDLCSIVTYPCLVEKRVLQQVSCLGVILKAKSLIFVE